MVLSPWDGKVQVQDFCHPGTMLLFLIGFLTLPHKAVTVL